MPITLASIKRKLDGKIGENLTVVAQAGRKKVTRRRGTLKETYPAILWSISTRMKMRSSVSLIVTRIF